MASLTAGQRRWRDRVEAGVRLAEPALNLVLASGELLSRIVQRQEDDYYPPQRGSLPSTVLPADDRSEGERRS